MQTTENPFDALQAKLDSLLAIVGSHDLKLDALTKSNNNTQTQKLTIKDFVRDFLVSKPTIHLLMRKGEIPFEKIGRKTLFNRKDVELYFASKQRKISQN